MGMFGDLGVHWYPLVAGQLTTGCLPLPGALLELVSKQSLTGGKGKLVGIGESGTPGCKYIAPSECGYGGGIVAWVGKFSGLGS